MYKEIEIRGLVTKRTFIEVDEQTINQIKSVHENKDTKWYEEYGLFEDLFWDAEDKKNKFIHVTRQGIDLQATEYTVKGVATRVFGSETPVQQVKTIADAYKGKYVAVQSLIGFVLLHGNIKCEEFDMSKLKFPHEYWKSDDELISCNIVIYDNEVYELDEHDFESECYTLEYEIGKFNDNGYLERILNFLAG